MPRRKAPSAEQLDQHREAMDELRRERQAIEGEPGSPKRRRKSRNPSRTSEEIKARIATAHAAKLEREAAEADGTSEVLDVPAVAKPEGWERGYSPPVPRHESVAPPGSRTCIECDTRLPSTMFRWDSIICRKCENTRLCISCMEERGDWDFPLGSSVVCRACRREKATPRSVVLPFSRPGDW